MVVEVDGNRNRLFQNWAWLFPATYLIHAMEEYWGGEGFYRWSARIIGRGMTPEQFISINSFGWLLMLVGVLIFRRTSSIAWLCVSLATVVLLNGLFHLAGSFWTGTYSPGAVSGTLLWIPLGAITLYRAWKHATRRSLRAGILVGIIIHAVLFLILLSIR